jgi:hypothetical protein
MKSDIATRLVRKLNLLQSPGEGTMQAFAKRVRELHRDGHNVDAAAIVAAKEKFPAEFQPTRYVSGSPAIEDLLAEIEKL